MPKPSSPLPDKVTARDSEFQYRTVEHTLSVALRLSILACASELRDMADMHDGVGRGR